MGHLHPAVEHRPTTTEALIESAPKPEAGALTNETDQQLDIIPQGLTSDEANFVYNTEVLNLPARTAARMAGMSIAKIAAPHIIQAREVAKKALQGHMAITKEDIVHGYKEAIDMAKILAEPMTMLVGWEKVAKILGHDQPQRVDINIHASVEVQKNVIRALSDDELVRQLGADNVIDAEFYVNGEKA